MRISASDYWRMFCHGDLEEQPQRVQAFAQAYADLNEKLGRLLAIQPGPPIPVEPGSNLAEIIERARVVGVLDAWAEKNECDPPHPVRQANGSFVVFWMTVGFGDIWSENEAVGSTPDAARAAAAKAIENGEV